MTISYPRSMPIVPVRSSRFGLSFNESAFASELSRKVSVQSHAAGKTDRWEGLISTGELTADQHATMRAWLISLRGRQGTFSLFDPDRKFPRGTIKPSGWTVNLAAGSNSFANTSFWANTNLTIVNAGNDVTLGTDHFSLTPTATSGIHTVSTALAQKIRVKGNVVHTLSMRLKANGYNHARIIVYLRDEDGNFLFRPGTASQNFINGKIDLTNGSAVIIGLAEDGAVVSSSDLTNGWYRLDATLTLPVAAFDAEIRVRVRNNSQADTYAGDTTSGILIANVQLEEASSAGAVEETAAAVPSVAGASQAGRSLSIDGLKASTSGLALVGDYFQVGSGFHMLLADMNANGSGAATLDFEPAMRVSPGDNDPVIFYNPRFVARLAGPDLAWETGPMMRDPVNFAFEEVL